MTENEKLREVILDGILDKGIEGKQEALEFVLRALVGGLEYTRMKQFYMWD